MADKLNFTLQIFSLGFTVVLVVLFLLYGLIALANRLRESAAAPQEILVQEPLPAEPDSLPAPLAAAIAAAINCYRESSANGGGPVRVRIIPQKRSSSSWAAAGRRALLENSTLWERLRRN